MKILSWFLDSFAPPTPAQHGTPVQVVQNSRGGWGLRWPDDAPDEEPIGNYATSADAARLARRQFQHVEIIDPAPFSPTQLAATAQEQATSPLAWETH